MGRCNTGITGRPDAGSPSIPTELRNATVMQTHPVLLSRHAPPPGQTWAKQEAHAVMQMRKEHPEQVCPALRHARHLLISSGVMVPANCPHL